METFSLHYKVQDVIAMAIEAWERHNIAKMAHDIYYIDKRGKFHNTHGMAASWGLSEKECLEQARMFHGKQETPSS